MVEIKQNIEKISLFKVSQKWVQICKIHFNVTSSND